MMAKSCRDPAPPVVCKPSSSTAEPRECAPFSVCTLAGEIGYDGSCVYFNPTNNPIPDGTYSTVTIKGGCIVGMGHAALPTYTPPDCCSSGGSGPTPQPDIPISLDACNLLRFAPDGLLATAILRAADSSVTIQGCGAGAGWSIKVNPDNIPAKPIVANAVPPLEVTGEGMPLQPFVVSMRMGPLAAGQYGPFVIDPYGLVIGYEAEPGTVVNVTGVDPIKVDTPAPNNFIVSLNMPDVPGGIFTFGRYTLTVSNYGTITNVVTTRPAIVPGKFYAPSYTTTGGDVIPAKIIEYDADGMIFNVIEV